VLVLMDIVHAACGLWPSDPLIGILQRLWCKVGHRSEIFISIALASRDDPNWSRAFGFMLFTWALADVSRFQLYCLRSLRYPAPHWLSWVRYSEFIVQYPLLIFAEALLVARAHLSSNGTKALLLTAPLTIGATALHPRRLESARVAAALSVLAASASAPGLSGWYAPVAIGFQVYEWLIFPEAYGTLWRVRAKRLHGKGIDDSLTKAGPPDTLCAMRSHVCG